MSDNILAKRFKARRLELKMSQVQVAEGICKQARISRIEKGDYSPGAELLYKLAKKMHVSVEYFFDESVEEENFENLGKFKELSRKLLDQRDYESLKYIYEMEVEKEQALSTSDKLYLEWIGCMVDFYAEGSQELAIKRVEEIVKEDIDNELYLTFVNTLMNFYFETKNENYADTYLEVSKRINSMRTNNISEIKMSIKIRYNYCRYLYYSGEIQKSIDETLDAIEICKKYHIMYVLGDLYCFLGHIYDEGKKLKNEAKYYYDLALTLFKIVSADSAIVVNLEKYLKENYSK
ncbi:MAG: helix-turn-helix domain-containing protein [Gemella sp.]|nr:helix-turn-helix domain-containing protein [Gemella sp.]